LLNKDKNKNDELNTVIASVDAKDADLANATEFTAASMSKMF